MKAAEPVLEAPAESREDRALAALGSRIRRRILDALAAGPQTIRALAHNLGLRPAALRYHLGVLASHGLVEEVPTAGQGRRGRPAATYQLPRHASVSGYPPRQFQLLAEVAIASLVETAGQDGAIRALSAKGVELGRALAEGLGRAEGVERWTPETFERAVVGKAFREYGVISEILSRGPDHLAYRFFTCPFLELAERIPAVVCDALDAGFHDGLDAATGARTERRACMGHGRPYCEYWTEWPEANPDPGRQPG